jgi:hypothetical protein
MKVYLSVFFLLLTFLNAVAQSDTTAWYEEDAQAGTLAISIGVGYYLGQNNTARFYSGQDNNRLNLLLNQPQIESQIQDELGGYPFELAAFAQDMRYNRTVSFSLGIDYRLKNQWQISAYFNQVRLQVAGIFTLRVQRQSQPGQADPFLEQVSIGGEERRSQIQLVLGKRFFLKSNFYVLAEGGLDFTFVEPEQNQFQIGQIYSLPITTLNNGVANNPIALGTGIVLGAGIGYQLPSEYGILLKTSFINTQINLNDVVDERVNVFLPTVAFTKAF